MHKNNPPSNGGPSKQQVDLRAKFQLGPQSPNVEKISGLVKGRESASMDEIAGIINTDSGITQRLMTIAYPKAAVNKVIVVMVGDLLTKAIYETFETMVEMPLEAADPFTTSMPDYRFMTAAVRFSGETNGQVTLAFPPHLSLIIAAKMLGGDADEHTPEAINDVIGELVNIVTGSLQSKLCDAGLMSEVSLPVVTFETALPNEAVPGGSNDHFFFHCGAHTLGVCLSIDPSKPRITQGKAPTTQGTTWRANGL